MKKAILITVVLTAFFGCTAQKAPITGFLSDYSKLKPVSDTTFTYSVPHDRVAQFSKFIIDPVEMYFHQGSTAIEERSKGQLKQADIVELQNYMRDALVKAIQDRYEVISQPGPGVARVRIAITDLKRSKIIQNIWPGSKLLGTGLGGASVEAELIDTNNGQQLGAVVDSQLGDRLSIEGLSTWGDAKSVMDRWGRQFSAISR